MFKKLHCILLALLLFGSQSYAQQDAQTRFQVLDSITRQPVVYATVVLKDSRIGVISDDNGNFRIPGIYTRRKDVLKISCIGYSTLFVILEDQQSSEINKIFLSPKIESLDEINLVIKGSKKQWSAGRIVKEAIKRIPDNYATEPFSYIAYYRDYQQINDPAYLKNRHITETNAYINLSEGVIQVFDAGFGTDRLKNELNQTVLFEFERNPDFPIDNALTIPYDNQEQKYLDGVIISPLGGNELNLLHLTDALRNYNRMSFSFAHVFNVDFLGNHVFKLKGLQYLDDTPIYSIDFVSNYKRVSQGHHAEGSISISKEDFGIYNLDYKLFNGKDNLLYRINLAYKPLADHYYLNYITFNNYFNVKGGDFFKIEQVVYDHRNSSFQVFFNEHIDPESIINRQKNFEFIIEDESIEIIDIRLIDSQTINIKIKSSKYIEQAIAKDQVRYDIKRIKDVKGRVLNEQNFLRADQFREIFVQKVFPEKPIDSTYEYVNKRLPLKSSKKNVYQGTETYWINTPLKANK